MLKKKWAINSEIMQFREVTLLAFKASLYTLQTVLGPATQFEKKFIIALFSITLAPTVLYKRRYEIELCSLKKDVQKN